MLSTYTAPEVKMTWRVDGIYVGHLKPRNQKTGLASAMVFTVKDRQLLPPASPGPDTLVQFREGEAEPQSCIINMLEDGKQRQAERESSGLGKDSRPTQIGQLITDPHLGGFPLGS